LAGFVILTGGGQAGTNPVAGVNLDPGPRFLLYLDRRARYKDL